MSGWLLWTTGAFGATGDPSPPPTLCPTEPVSVVREQCAEVEAAYIDNDIVAFDTVAEALARTIGCIDTPIDPATAVEIHQAMGLRAFVSRDPAGAARSLRAVRLLDPNWRPRADWMRDGQPLYALYLEDLPSNHTTLSTTGGRDPWVDGRPTDRVPANEAFVLQLVDGRRAGYTGYHASVATLPDFGDDRRARSTVRAVGTSLAVALLGGSLASELGAASARTSLRDPSTPAGELTGLYERSKKLRSAAIGLGIGSAATAGITWVVPW